MDTDNTPARGDLWVVMPDDGTPRVVLILNNTDGHIEVALVHTAPELATSHDIICEPSTVTVAWPVVVQTDLRGVTPRERMLRPVGRVAMPPVGDRGVVIGGPTTDRRWQFKHDEGRVLSAVTLGLADLDQLDDRQGR